LIDKDSLIITYDAKRGDPRGSRSRKADSAAHGLGDCIDCTLCVQVCPTGIDIRNGLQNECIGCAACIDVCNDVMDKMGYARGLIRYSTENGVVNGWTRLQMFKRALRPRVLIYGAVLSAASVAFAASVAMRSPFKFDVVKDRGALARVVEEGAVENVYRIQIMNRTEAPQTYRVDASGIDGLEVVATPASAGPAAVTSTNGRRKLTDVDVTAAGPVGARDVCGHGRGAHLRHQRRPSGHPVREVDVLHPPLNCGGPNCCAKARRNSADAVVRDSFAEDCQDWVRSVPIDQPTGPAWSPPIATSCRPFSQMRFRSTRWAVAAIPAHSNVRSAIAPTVRVSYAPPLHAWTPKAANTRPVAAAMKTASGTDQRRRCQSPRPQAT